jgi:UDP-N-acetylmuramoyl-L-alanyl-D-glutamate--2,6-diaminopimelate ligase
LVFGAGGERDKDKRQIMGAIARKYCDVIYVTDDNPRHEDAASIRKQIISGCPSATEIGDRSEAITIAINKATFDDIVIIAGKGHEQVQVVKDNNFPFSDFEQASTAIELMEQVVSG